MGTSAARRSRPRANERVPQAPSLRLRGHHGHVKFPPGQRGRQMLAKPGTDRLAVGRVGMSGPSSRWISFGIRAKCSA